MAMPVLEPRYWTAEDVRALPDDRNRYECIDGVLLVTPAPTWDHGYVIDAFQRALDGYLGLRGPLRVTRSPSDVEIVPRTLVQPDLFIATGAVTGRRMRDWREITGLALAIEVLSPSTARVDRARKRTFYQQAGVLEYWIVDKEARVVERWRPNDDRPEVLQTELVWHPPGMAEPLRIDLPALFVEALDD